MVKLTCRPFKIWKIPQISPLPPSTTKITREILPSPMEILKIMEELYLHQTEYLHQKIPKIVLKIDPMEIMEVLEIFFELRGAALNLNRSYVNTNIHATSVLKPERSLKPMMNPNI